MCRLMLLPNIAQALCHTKQNFQDLVLAETVKDMASTIIMNSKPSSRQLGVECASPATG
jgi:hypothetical protein